MVREDRIELNRQVHIQIPQQLLMRSLRHPSSERELLKALLRVRVQFCQFCDTDLLLAQLDDLLVDVAHDPVELVHVGLQVVEVLMGLRGNLDCFAGCHLKMTGFHCQLRVGLLDVRLQILDVELDCVLVLRESSQDLLDVRVGGAQLLLKGVRSPLHGGQEQILGFV